MSDQSDQTRQWFYALGSEQRGPVSESDLDSLIVNGEIGPASLVWTEGMENWAPAQASLPGVLIPQAWVDNLPRGGDGSEPLFGGAQTNPGYAQPGSTSGGPSASGYYHPTQFVDVIGTVFSRYTQISGRARRSEYWYWILFYVLASIALIMVDTAIFSDAVASIGVFGNIFALAVLVPSICVTARRLHDIGRSGWWQLIGLIPLLGVIIMIWWMTRPSDPHENQYGPA